MQSVMNFHHLKIDAILDTLLEFELPGNAFWIIIYNLSSSTWIGSEVVIIALIYNF